MKKSFTRIGVSVCNSIPHSFFVNKNIKLLLLNALDNEENYLNVTYLIEYFKKRTWYLVYQPPAVILVYFLSNNKTPVLEFV